jgi:hypothetical protein
MNTRKSILWVALVAVVGLVAGAADAGRPASKKSRKGLPSRAETFAVSGEYTGALSGEILVAGQSVFIPKGVTIYHVTDGAQEYGETFASASVYVSGTVQKGRMVARIVVVGDRASRNDYSQTTLSNVEAPPNQAR